MRVKGEVVGAVDFGSRDIRVLIARREDDGVIQVIGHGVAPGRGCISQGVIQDLNAAQVTLKRALAAAEKEARVHVPSLFCGVNGKNVETFIREGSVKIDRGLVEQSHMGEALEIASRDIVVEGKRILASVTSQEWYVDDLRVLDPIGIRGQVLKMRVHFARLPSVIEDNVITCVESQKRELEDIIFMPLATSLGCLTPEDIELGAAVLDIGRSTTGLAVYRDYRLLGTHCFEWGGYHLTRDVAAGLQVSFEEADELILEYGISDEFVRQEVDDEDDDRDTDTPAPASPDSRASRLKLKTAVHGAPSIVERRKLDLIIYERAKELMMKVRQHLNARGLSKHLVRGVVLTGGAGAIRNHAALAESIFQVPCRVGIPDSVEILPHSVNSPEFSASVGIVRHAFEHRAAAKRGRIEPRGSVVNGIRRIGKFLRKYFI